MATDRTSGPAFKTWDETGLYTRPDKKRKPKTIGRALGKPQKAKKLKPSKVKTPPRENEYGTYKHEWDLNTRTGMIAFIQHGEELKKKHATNIARTNKHGKPSKARVPAKGTSRAKKKHPK